MSRRHLANTPFEFELAAETSFSLQEGIEQFPITLQLQYLPLLYAAAGDTVAVTSLPGEEYQQGLLSLGLWKTADELAQCVLLDAPLDGAELEVWGWSQSVAKWAKEQGSTQPGPSWGSVLYANSKATSFQLTEPLPGASLLNDESQLITWLSRHSGLRVLKYCFGVAGRGLRLIDADMRQPSRSVLKFCRNEWRQGRPIIAEPWVIRILDFSSQWNLNEDGSLELIGPALLQNSPQGVYSQSVVAPNEVIIRKLEPHWTAHVAAVEAAVRSLYEHGYYGPVAVDAMIYTSAGREILHPIVEINARRTMTLTALSMQKKWYPDQSLTFSYKPSAGAHAIWLPQNLNDQKIGRQLSITPLQIP